MASINFSLGGQRWKPFFQRTRYARAISRPRIPRCSPSATARRFTEGPFWKRRHPEGGPSTGTGRRAAVIRFPVRATDRINFPSTGWNTYSPPGVDHEKQELGIRGVHFLRPFRFSGFFIYFLNQSSKSTCFEKLVDVYHLCLYLSHSLWSSLTQVILSLCGIE
ncbi:hypothetical protein MTO96_025497 [Rhipicephalus appendiculatus]